MSGEQIIRTPGGAIGLTSSGARALIGTGGENCGCCDTPDVFTHQYYCRTTIWPIDAATVTNHAIAGRGSETDPRRPERAPEPAGTREIQSAE